MLNGIAKADGSNGVANDYQTGVLAGHKPVDSREKRIAEYLAKAKDAEEKAEQAQDPSMREKWLALGASYRALAKTT